MTALARDIPAHFTWQQRAFIEMVRDTGHHIFLRATAGAGKTTTLVEAAYHLPQRGVFFAYNKHAVTDLQSRLPSRMRARTLHAHGIMLLRQHAQTDVAPMEDKSRMVATLVGERRASYAAARAWSMAREEGLRTLDEDDAAYIATAAEWPGEASTLLDLIPQMHAVGQQLWEEQRLADFTDFLWLPVTNGYGAASVSLGLVDEAQDLTPLRQHFLLHLLGLPESASPGRLIFVGDPDQAIYKYAGADPLALDRLKIQVQAQELPLSVSFRCPQAVVAYAQVHSAFIQPAPEAKQGRIEHVSAEEVAFGRGEVVLCRTNAPLIRLALQLMMRGQSFSMVGRDLEKRLGEGLVAILPATGTYRNDDVTKLVRGYYLPRAAPLQERIRQGDRPAKRGLTDLLDLSRCLRFLAWVVSRKQGVGTLGETQALLAALCREQMDADVVLSSVHRAKGKEWPRVTILYPEMMPLLSGEAEEETAVQFVAITRAQEVLRFAYGTASWASGWRVQPVERGGGMFAQVLECPEVSPAQARPHAREPEMPGLVSKKGSLPLETPLIVAECTRARLAEHQAAPEATPVRPDLPADDRVWPLLGGQVMVSRVGVQARLQVLLDEPRPYLVTWARQSLEQLDRTPLELVPVHLMNLELFERAARLARVAIPNREGVTDRQAEIYVFEATVARVRLARVVRKTARMVRVEWKGHEYRFDPQTGELLEGGGPLSVFMRLDRPGRAEA